MPQRSKHPAQSTDEPPPTAPPESRYRIEHYGKSRYFAVYEGQTLVALTVYRKGAEEITARLDAQERTIAALQSQLAALAQAPPAPSLPPLAANVNGSVWHPPQQLALIAAEAMRPYRTTSPRRRPAPAPHRS